MTVNKPIGPVPKIATVSPNRTSPSDSVNINQYQEKETEVPHKDISESKSDKIMQEEAQKKDVPSNPNDNDTDIDEKGEETKSKKGFWSRFFGG